MLIMHSPSGLVLSANSCHTPHTHNTHTHTHTHTAKLFIASLRIYEVTNGTLYVLYESHESLLLLQFAY